MVLSGLATAEAGYAQKKSGISSYMILPRKIQSALDCIPARDGNIFCIFLFMFPAKANCEEKEGPFMKNVFLCLAVSLTLGIVSPWVRGVFADEDNRGKSIYEDKCLICHGIKGEGNGPASAALSPRATDFTNPNFWEGDVDKKIADTIRKGRPPMPAFEMNDDEIKAITDYMSRTFKKTK
jgi:cytochrome c5